MQAAGPSSRIDSAQLQLAVEERGLGRMIPGKLHPGLGRASERIALSIGVGPLKDILPIGAVSRRGFEVLIQAHFAKQIEQPRFD